MKYEDFTKKLCSFIKEGKNVIVCGDKGIGKTNFIKQSIQRDINVSLIDLDENIDDFIENKEKPILAECHSTVKELKNKLGSLCNDKEKINVVLEKLDVVFEISYVLFNEEPIFKVYEKNVDNEFKLIITYNIISQRYYFY